MNQEKIAGTNMVAIDTKDPFTTYVSLIDDDKFERVFQGTNVQAKTWDTLRITTIPSDIFGISPDHLTMHSLECITF
jgi:hypothetical protein